MAIKIHAITQNKQLLKMVSVLDDAIDWEATYPDESSQPRKESRYKSERNVNDLTFKEGESPTVFVFEHPDRVDVARKVRGLYQRGISSAGSKDQNDIWTEVWDKTFLGTQEGFEGKLEAPTRRGDHITDGYFQGVEDAGVFEEFAGAFLDIGGKNKAAERAAAKKK